ncbi:MAG: iron ABC transporter permease, partial [Thermoprotei archaeon]
MRRAFLAILAVATLLAVAASLALGSYRGVGPCTLAKLLSGSPLSPVERWVLARRLLRTVAAALLGIGLGVSGAGLQYVLRNPLADPYLLGLASG